MRAPPWLRAHVRDAATGHESVDFDLNSYSIERLKQAVPNMSSQVGRSVSVPNTDDVKAMAQL